MDLSEKKELVVGFLVRGFWYLVKKVTDAKRRVQPKIEYFMGLSARQKLQTVKIPLIALAVFVVLISAWPFFAPPKISFSFPGNGSLENSLDTQIEIVFDREMNKTSVEKGFSINPPTEGTISWESSQKLIFSPKVPLVRGEKYVVSLEKMPVSRFVSPLLGNKKIEFFTLGDPKVVVFSPETEAVEDLAKVMVVFDRPMIALTTATNSALKKSPITISPVIAGEGRWLGTTAYQFMPSVPFKKATTYTVSVENNLKSMDGGVLDQDYSWQFSSARPRVIDVSPDQNYRYASPVASVSATFNQVIDRNSVTGHFKVFDEQNKEATGRLAVSGKTIGFYPSPGLVREKTYRAVITAGLLSTDGPNGLESDYSWSFSVADKPKITETTPANGQTEVKNENVIKITFKTPMDEDSFADNISISPTPETKPGLYFSSYQNVHTLNIGTYLLRSQKYTVTIGAGVRDQYGVNLGTPYTFSFTTAPYDPNVTIVPFGTYFATFNQKIIPRIVAQVKNAQQVNYALYKLNKSDLLELYRRRYENVCGNNYTTCRNWQDYNPGNLEKVRSWNEDFEVNPNVPVNVVSKITNSQGGALESGFYFLDVRVSTGQHDNLVMIVSNATLTVKKSNQQIFSWAVDQSNGEVISGMDMTLSDSFGKALAEGKTNQDGVWQKDVNLDKTNNLILMATKGNDVVVSSSNWGEGINRYDFGLPYYYNYQESVDYENSNNRFKLFLTPDRPIYRPGQKVFFKGLIKKDNDAAYANLTPGEEVSVKIEDAMGREVYRKELGVNSFGAFFDTFSLSPDANLGYYKINADYKKNANSQEFQVEEYRKPEMLLTIKNNKDFYLPGETPSLSINSSYYFGAPVANSPVRWSLTASDYFFDWSKNRNFEFGDFDDYWSRWWGYSGGSTSVVNNGKGTTDSQGNLVLHTPFSLDKFKTSQRLSLEASVSDESNQTVGSSSTVVMHKGGIYVGLHPERYIGRSGEESKVEIVTVAPNESEVPNTSVAVEFFKRTWDTVREQDPDTGKFMYVSRTHDNLVSSAIVTTDNLGYTKTAFTPTEGGTYRVVASVTDPAGNVNRSSCYMWISGYGFMTDRANNDRILIVPDKREYNVGEMAAVFVNSPFASGSATTLLTAERSKVISYKIVKTSDESNNFPVEIVSNYAPNIYLGAVLIKGGQEIKAPPEMKVGYVEVKVTDKKQQLTVDIQTDKKKYKPGETLHAIISTRNLLGHPVASELAVGLVDKAVWDLSSVTLPDIYKFFYQPRNLEVDTSQLLSISMDRINANTNLGSKGGSGGCFTAETPVLIPGGSTKPISEIKPGDNVLTKTNPDSSDLKSGKVSAVLKHSVDHYLIINGEIRVTPVHVMYVNNTWKVAGSIQIGDQLLDQRNLPVKVFSIERVFGQNIPVYNLEVEKYHTYFANGIFVHNQKGDELDTSRKDFPDTAYWNPSLVTGQDGKAEITLKLPDNLTTWRLAAIADTTDSAFGSSINEFKVSRDILIRPMLPRFLSVGDQAQLGAIIVNTSGEDAAVDVKISGQGVSINSAALQSAVIANGDQVKFLWTTSTNSTDSARVRISVNNKAGTELDSLQMDLPVKSYSVPEVVATSGQAADVAQEEINLPKDVDPTRGQVEISISPSLGIGSLDAINYLSTYLYNCTEQTTSKFASAIYVRRVLKLAKLDQLGSISVKQLETMIDDGLQRLNNTQHSDGGWNWWTEEESDPLMSAYAYMGLVEAKKDGYSAADKTVDAAKRYLTDHLSSSRSDYPLNDKVYLMYALKDSNTNLTGYAANMYDRRYELNLQSRALLAMILRQAGLTKQANRIYQEVVSLAEKTATSTHFEDKGNRYYYYWHSGVNITTATALQMMIMFNPRHPYIPEVVRYLMAGRTDKHWVSTQETATVIKAITSQILTQENKNLNENYKLEVNGKEMKSGKFEAKDLLALQNYLAPVSDLSLGSNNSFRISKSGTGNLYYNFNLRYFLPFSQITSLDQGITIMREFIDNKGKILPAFNIKEGTDAWVRLTVVTPATRQYVTVEDILPAGLESVNESLKNVVSLNKEPISRSSTGYDDFGGWSYFGHKEYHDDRTTLFARYLPAGVYEIVYKVRATTPGKYHYLPAQAYEMYFPDVSGHSEGGWLTVEKSN